MILIITELPLWKVKQSITGEINALVIKVAGESEKGTSIKIPVNDDEEMEIIHLSILWQQRNIKILIENIAKKVDTKV